MSAADSAGRRGVRASSDRDCALRKSDVGYSSVQFFPETNPLGIIPRGTSVDCRRVRVRTRRHDYPETLGETRR